MRRMVAVLVVLLLGAGAGYYFLALQQPPETTSRPDAFPEKTEYQLKVREVSGEPEAKFPHTDTGWTSVAPGQVLPEGSQVRAGEDSGLQMVVPERAYFTFEKGELSVSEVAVDTTVRQPSDTAPEETVEQNELELETERGTLRSSVREDTKSSNNYKIRTPSAVMGIRGTTYGCQTDEAGSTSCAVLEGEVRFSSRTDTGRSVDLTAGRISSVNRGETEPSEPTSYSQSRKEDLRDVRSTAEKELRKRPVVHGVTLDDTPITARTKFTYRSQRRIRLVGRADSRSIAPIGRVEVRVNGERLETNGTRRWSAVLNPEAPAPGSTRRLSLTVQAHAGTDRSSLLEHYELILHHPLEVPPPGYEHQSMKFTLRGVGPLERDAFEMPFTLYTSDLSDQRLTLSGTVQPSDGSVERLAYRVNKKDSWEQKRTDEDWTLSVTPPDAREWTLDVMAMTDRETHSEVETFGSFRNSQTSARRAIRQNFETFWDSFVQKNWSDLAPLLSDEFQFNHPEDGPVDGETFRDVLSTYGRNTGDLSVLAKLNAIDVGTDRATLSADVELTGELDEGSEGPLGMPPVANGYEGEGDFVYRRGSDGIFRLKRLEGRERTQPEPKDEIGTTIPLTTGTSRSLTLSHRTGLDLGELTAVDNSSSQSAQRQDGHLVAGLDPKPFEWSGDPSSLYVNNGSHTFCSGYYCYDYPVRSGGIRPAPTNDLSELESFPALREGAFEDDVAVEEGNLYFVNVKTSSDGNRKAIIRVDEVPESASGSLSLTVIEVR